MWLRSVVLCCAVISGLQMPVWLILVVRAGPRTTPCARERSAAACMASVGCCQVSGEHRHCGDSTVLLPLLQKSDSSVLNGPGIGGKVVPPYHSLLRPTHRAALACRSNV